MEPIRAAKTRLAYQVDRKILNAQDEDYYRLDVSAHEKVPMPKPKRKFQSPITKKHLQFVKTFVLTAGIIYAGLFVMTNAAAYTKIMAANLQDAYEARKVAVEQQEQQTAEQIASLESEKLDVESVENSEVENVVNANDGVYPLTIMPTSFENRLSIPSLNINAPIVEPELGLDALVSNDWNELEDQIRSSLLLGVVHYPGTAKAGEKGNFFLTGHSSNVFWELSPYNTIFALLPKIEVGADIFVTYGQTEHHYRVTDKKEVSPKDTNILAQGESKTATLMTCVPVGTTLKRLVVTAELVQN